MISASAGFINERLAPLASRDNVLIVFPHVPRTGGKAIVKHVLVPRFGEARIYHSNRIPSPKRWNRLTDRDLAEYAAYTSMDNFSANRVSRLLLPIAILRHPVYRAISLYHYTRRKEDHPDRGLARKLDMEEFFYRASRRNRRYYCEAQCLRICNKPDARLALEFVKSRYFAVGLTQELPDFARMLARQLGGPEPEIVARPTDAERYDAQITSRFRDIVLESNREDLALFDAISRGSVPVHAPSRSPLPVLLSSIGPVVLRKLRSAHRRLLIR